MNGGYKAHVVSHELSIGVDAERRVGEGADTRISLRMLSVGALYYFLAK